MIAGVARGSKEALNDDIARLVRGFFAVGHLAVGHFVVEHFAVEKNVSFG